VNDLHGRHDVRLLQRDGVEIGNHLLLDPLVPWAEGANLDQLPSAIIPWLEERRHIDASNGGQRSQ